jgi:ABC-2 type transport system permease protein
VIAQLGQGPTAAPGQPDHFYGVQMLASIVLFTFFSEATNGAVKSVVENEALVRKIQFPRLVIPVAIVLQALFNLGLNLIVVLVFALGSGVRPMLSWLEVPVIIAMLTVLSVGVAMLLSALYVYFRDMAPIWEVVSQVLFYASPVIVPLATVEKHLSPALVKVYMLNPLATMLQQFRHAAVNHPAPGASAVLGGHAAVLGPIAIVLAVFGLGFVVFNRTAPYVAENL